MKIAKDLRGQNFGRLKALYDSGQRDAGYLVWVCLCSCGNICKVRSSNLIQGYTRSCGCLRKSEYHKTIIKKEKKSHQIGFFLNSYRFTLTWGTCPPLGAPDFPKR